MDGPFSLCYTRFDNSGGGLKSHHRTRSSSEVEHSVIQSRQDLRDDLFLEWGRNLSALRPPHYAYMGIRNRHPTDRLGGMVICQTSDPSPTSPRSPFAGKVQTVGHSAQPQGLQASHGIDLRKTASIRLLQ